MRSQYFASLITMVRNLQLPNSKLKINFAMPPSNFQFIFYFNDAVSIEAGVVDGMNNKYKVVGAMRIGRGNRCTRRKLSPTLYFLINFRQSKFKISYIFTVCLSFVLSVCSSVRRSIHPSIHPCSLRVCLFIYSCLFVHLCIRNHPPTSVFSRPSDIVPADLLSIHPLIHVSIYLTIHLSTVHHLSIHSLAALATHSLTRQGATSQPRQEEC
jgi:hypothetical protein